MKLLLVQSPTGRREEPIFPLGLACLAGQLQGHEIRVLDLGICDDPRRELADAVGSFAPEVTAISLRNIDDSSWPRTHSYLAPFGEALSALSGYRGAVVVGGPGFSIYPETLMKAFPRIDYGVAGEGEEALPFILETLGSGSTPPRLTIPPRPDLTAIRPPAYSLFDLAPYARGFGVGVQSRRGCSFSCRYCTYSFLGGRSFRCRPVEAVAADVENLARLGVERFQFVDSVFDAPRDYFRSLVRAVARLEAHMEWGAWLDTGVEAADLAAMKAAGAVKVDLSPDAITARGLRMLGKNGRPSDLYPSVAAARRAGLAVGVNFFSGNPGEGFAALVGKLLFMLRARLLLGWGSTFVSIGTIRVYAHSGIAEDMVRDGRAPAGADFLAPVFLEPRGAARWLHRAFLAARDRRHGE
jgi:anaerobic magnesium-protoporphyrin IX monomethyl ester cyclase